MKMIKKPLSLLLSLIMIFSLFAIVPVSAAETDEAPVGDKTITYIENDGRTATKSGYIQLTADTKTLEEVHRRSGKHQRPDRSRQIGQAHQKSSVSQRCDQRRLERNGHL